MIQFDVLRVRGFTAMRGGSVSFMSDYVCNWYNFAYYIECWLSKPKKSFQVYRAIYSIKYAHARMSFSGIQRLHKLQPKKAARRIKA